MYSYRKFPLLSHSYFQLSSPSWGCCWLPYFLSVWFLKGVNNCGAQDPLMSVQQQKAEFLKENIHQLLAPLIAMDGQTFIYYQRPEVDRSSSHYSGPFLQEVLWCFSSSTVLYNECFSRNHLRKPPGARLPEVALAGAALGSQVWVSGMEVALLNLQESMFK